MSLTLTPLTHFPIIEAGDDLAGAILDALRFDGIGLADGDILVLRDARLHPKKYSNKNKKQQQRNQKSAY